MNESFVDGVRVPVVVSVASRKMALGGVQRIKKGAILEFGKRYDEPLEIKANNVRIGGGKALILGWNYGIRVSGIDAVEGSVP